MHAEPGTVKYATGLPHSILKVFVITVLLAVVSGCATKSPAPNPDDSLLQAPGAETQPTNTALIADMQTVEKSPVEAIAVPEVTLEYPDSAWTRLRASQTFNGYEELQAVRQQLEYLVGKPDMIIRFVERSEPFLVYIIEQLEEENLPVELAVLPYIESAYNASATSRKGAAGLWQIMLGTARDLNVQQTIWYDGRRDLEESTASAINYLRFLSNKFEQDWLLSLAAYNAGPNKVKRLVDQNHRQNKPSSFWDLKLPRETRTYVPRFLAFLEILKYPEQYGIDLPHIENHTVVDSIAVRRPVDISALNSKLGLSANLLSSLNRGYIRDVTPPGNVNWPLVVPHEVSALAALEIEKMPIPDLSNHTLTHRIQTGETLSHIARRYGVKIPHIQRINNLSSSRIRAGKKLTIPAPLLKSQEVNQPVSSTGTHVVKRGDNLWRIARRYNLSVNQISELNQLDISAPLIPGRILTIR